MLPKAAVSVLGSFRETRETVNTQSQRKLETPMFKHSALGLKFRFFRGATHLFRGGAIGGVMLIFVHFCPLLSIFVHPLNVQFENPCVHSYIIFYVQIKANKSVPMSDLHY